MGRWGLELKCFTAVNRGKGITIGIKLVPNDIPVFCLALDSFYSFLGSCLEKPIKMHCLYENQARQSLGC